jgi:hypothetical protein
MNTMLAFNQFIDHLSIHMEIDEFKDHLEEAFLAIKWDDFLIKNKKTNKKATSVEPVIHMTTSSKASKSSSGKRPPSTYNIFVKTQMSYIKDKKLNKNHSDILALWKLKTPEVKKTWKDGMIDPIILQVQKDIEEDEGKEVEDIEEDEVEEDEVEEDEVEEDEVEEDEVEDIEEI